MEGSVTKKAQMENRMKTGIEQFRWEGKKKKKKILVTKLLRLIIISEEFNIFFSSFFTTIHCAGSFENFYNREIAILQ